MDDPRRVKLRLVVQAGFTPRSIATIEASVRERAHRLVMSAKELGGTLDYEIDATLAALAEVVTTRTAG